MKSLIVPLLFIAAQAHAQLPDATLSTPGSAMSNEDMHLIQASPALQANAIVTSTEKLQFDSSPKTVGSMFTRAPGEGSTLVDLSIANASATDNVSIWGSDSIGNPAKVNSNIDYQATQYTLHVAYGLTDESAVFLDGGFMKSRIEFDSVPMDNRQGMRDFEIGYLGRSPSARSSWIYGISIGGSPESISGVPQSQTAGFSGGTVANTRVSWERRLTKATAGLHFNNSFSLTQKTKSNYYEGNEIAVDKIGDFSATYQFPLYRTVGFGVKAGVGILGPMSDRNNYHASAAATVDTVEDIQFKVEAEGSSAGYASGSGSTTTIVGVLSKTL